MASVAICPHCYLQLVVPDGVDPDERVECPTCAKEFGLDQAVLRAIPEVVRRAKSDVAAPSVIPLPGIAAHAVDSADVEEVIEVDEFVAEISGEREPDVIEQIKARIESELDAGGLLPGMSGSLSLESPADELAAHVPPAEQSEFLDEWHRPTERLRDIRTFDEERHEDDAASAADVSDEFSIDDDLQLDVKAVEVEAVEIETEEIEAANPERDEVSEVADSIDELLEPTDVGELEAELVEPPFVRPATTTLADLMPTREEYEEREELAESQVPSFELPNVPLTPAKPSPANSAAKNLSTAEIDPDMPFGPAAETEFALDDVDLEATPMDKPAAEEAAEANEPVFSDPQASPVRDTPFILPGIPKPRKKRNVVRTLVGTMLGGMVGLAAGYAILLYLLGPDGDLLQVANYIPSAMLPKSFDTSRPPVVARTNEPAGDDSANVPATYTEEVPAESGTSADESEPSETTPTDDTTDDRYAAEPSPLDEPTAEPIADATQSATLAPLPIQGPTITIEQLASGLETAKQAQDGLVAGDLSDAAVRRTKGMSYAKLCDLAEALTFVDPAAPSVESEQAIDGSVRLFRETLSDAHTRQEVARIATIWMNSPHRRHGGVFLAGTLNGGEISGDVYEYHLVTDDGSELTLLAAEPLDPSVEGSQLPVGIVGTIISKAADEVAGYTGTAERAIWVARAIPLE